jgi:hypothetical protein
MGTAIVNNRKIFRMSSPSYIDFLTVCCRGTLIYLRQSTQLSICQISPADYPSIFLADLEDTWSEEHDHIWGVIFRQLKSKKQPTYEAQIGGKLLP